jgi:hypothetical protein
MAPAQRAPACARKDPKGADQAVKQQAQDWRALDESLRARYCEAFKGDCGWAHEYVRSVYRRYAEEFDRAQLPRGPRFSDVVRAIEADRSHTKAAELYYHDASTAVHGGSDTAFIDLGPTYEIQSAPSRLGLGDVALPTAVELTRLTEAYADGEKGGQRISPLIGMLRALSEVTQELWEDTYFAPDSEMGA